MARKWHYTDWEERRKRQDPEHLLRGIGLGEGEVFVDMGSGNGFFSIPAARMVGHGGLVYALDANPEAVESMMRLASEQGLSNIRGMVGRAEETPICSGCADMVFFAEVLHDFQDQDRVLRNAHRALRPGGRIVNLDWKKDSPYGPPRHIKFTEEQASGLLRVAGFEIDSVVEHDEHHYMIRGHRS